VCGGNSCKSSRCENVYYKRVSSGARNLLFGQTRTHQKKTGFGKSQMFHRLGVFLGFKRKKKPIFVQGEEYAHVVRVQEIFLAAERRLCAVSGDERAAFSARPSRVKTTLAPSKNQGTPPHSSWVPGSRVLNIGPNQKRFGVT